MTERQHATGRDLAALPDAIEEQVLAALELDGEAREAALATIFAEHPTHAATVRRWIADAERGDTVATAPRAHAEAEPVPAQLGPYRIVRLLGRGGFGSVYLAEQSEPFHREVAVKVLNPGMNSREVLQRFAGEREALNRMDHPGIARLLDAGETPSGRPYFVMEYVPGVPIHVWCRKRDLDMRARLQLFLLVLDAMQHAHQKAVLHRDLSTSNVLVVDHDGKPQPKIIDFGIAKSLAAPLTEAMALTMHGTMMGTPEFMSPEQASGLADIDTRTDIYALGVQLYELLCDELPIPSRLLRNHAVADIGNLVRDFQPSLPSQLAPPSRQALLRGDLDWIVMKALRKDRADRYASVSEFAADISRHLHHEPVTAGPPSTFYRLRKFVRRNRVQVAAGATVVLGLLLALAIALGALVQLQQEKNDKEQAQREQYARADAGFRLLANAERLQAAAAAEPQIYPPWPDRVPALQEWLRDFGEPLAQALDEVRLKLVRLDQESGGKPSTDASARHLHRALLVLQSELQKFVAPRGPLQRVRRSLATASSMQARSIDAHRDAWTAAAAAIRESDGVTASQGYRGLQLLPQPGLVPLGMDPSSKLWEFLDLQSHPTNAPIPRRGDDDRLQLPPGCGVVFVLLPPGEFWMGSYRGEPGMPQNDPQAGDDELPANPVMLEAFFLARTELTNEQWVTLNGGDSPARFTDQLGLPVENVSWDDAEAVLTRACMQLPTEAQWEYGCRAGKTTPWYFGADADAVGKLVRADLALQGPAPVGLLPANAFGLCDMHGNVAEWCRDWLTDYRTRPRANDGMREPARVALAPGRVVRGGAYDLPLWRARSACREAREPGSANADLGLRPARLLIL